MAVKEEYENWKQGVRPWVAKFKYPEHKEFYFGPVLSFNFHPKFHELEERVWKAWEEVVPKFIGRPKLIDIIPGTITFHKDEKNYA